MIAQVAMAGRAKAIDRLFDYEVPTGMVVNPGQRVEVPFGPRVVEGYVISLQETHIEPDRPLKSVARILEEPDGAPALSRELVHLVEFMRNRYLCTWGAAIAAVLPPVTRYKEVQTLAIGSHGTEQLPQDVVALLSKRPRITVDALVRRCSGVTKSQIGRWVSAGLLDRVQAVEPRMVQHQVQWVSVADTGAKPTRGTQRQRVLQYLSTIGGTAPTAHVLENTEVSAGVVRAMVRDGVLHAVLRDADPVQREESLSRKLTLTDEQATALSYICSAVAAKRRETFVLRGVTGSGKTEVYLQAIDRVLEQGRQAIMLVPEISLTAQMTARFRARFGQRVAILHSRLSDREKYEEWLRIRRGQADVIVGARSAIFAPVASLGLIIVDEEHESTYKQDTNPRYLVREVAAERALRHHAVTVLGSATPSLETMHRADRGRYQLLHLTRRVEDRPLPSVDIVDMRASLQSGTRNLFSAPLRDALRDVLERGEQAILFLNRRGYATVYLCRDCGEVATCPHCDISLTLHSGTPGTLRCHLCGFADVVRPLCASCGSARVRQFGAGTQRVEADLLDIFPGVRVVRMDVDTTTRKGAHEQLIAEFERGDADVLLGTQMIAKGLDFANVSLVGVIAADTSLRIPDFRAAERTFQLLVQVAGRAGRHQIPGRVIVQTFSPEHYAIQTAAKQDYDAFYAIEMNLRKGMKYPPFTEITQFTLSHTEDSVAAIHARTLQQELVDAFLDTPDDVRVLAAVPMSIAKARNLYRYQVIVKYKSFPRVSSGLTACFLQAVARAKSDVNVQVDVNSQAQ